MCGVFLCWIFFGGVVLGKPFLVSQSFFLRKKEGFQGYKPFFMLNSTEHEISTAHRNLNDDNTISFLL